MSEINGRLVDVRTAQQQRDLRNGDLLSSGLAVTGSLSPFSRIASLNVHQAVALRTTSQGGRSDKVPGCRESTFTSLRPLWCRASRESARNPPSRVSRNRSCNGSTVAPFERQHSRPNFKA
ncbi:hypothetical protein SAY87_014324 [Trapa incisa]|uniref:Uncharacterized protein n=1 Tax=Trapa incisa TaxID=236973 RepID=A0AAN7GVF8_9MYRT|nr:hypothetical protein SAY87_014324 [Trapa incisa]